jgi:RNA 3'-terminal phosphate cyclase-like protein
MSSNSGSKTIKFEDGAVQFRQRLVVSILSHRPILIRNIRADDVDSPGLQEHEASFLRLLDRMTNGSNVEINATGTQLRFKPGILLGGDIVHSCPVAMSKNSGTNDSNVNTSSSSSSMSKSVGWFLEGILPLAPFGKEPLHLTLQGITDGACHTDPSPDYIATSILPHFLRFGIGDDPDESPRPYIKVTQRGAAPLGGGEVQFYCPIVKEITKPLDLIDPGKVKRVRGTVVSCRIPASSAARVAHSAKGLLHRLLPDVWIHTDTHSGSRKQKQHDRGVLACGASPGLSVCLAAETNTGIVLAAETCLDVSKDVRGSVLPEDLGVRGAAMLLDEIRKGGCIDTGAQSTILLLMCLGPEDIMRIRVGTLSQYTIVSLRLFKRVFGVEFKVKPDHDSKTVLLSCLGSGYRNMAKAST